MASTSENTADQSTEKPPEKPAAEAAAAAAKNDGGKINMHVALPRGLIEKLKNVKNWGQHKLSYDEEKVRKVWEWQSTMTFEELFNHVLYADGEEVVWDDDVWGLQQIDPRNSPPSPEKPKGS